MSRTRKAHLVAIAFLLPALGLLGGDELRLSPEAAWHASGGVLTTASQEGWSKISNGSLSVSYRWDPELSVPYSLDPNLNEWQRERVRDSLAMVEEVSCVRFQESEGLLDQDGARGFHIAWVDREAGEEADALASLVEFSYGPSSFDPASREMFRGEIKLIRDSSLEVNQLMFMDVIAHEVMHILGLGHVEDEESTLYPRSDGRLTMSEGDIEGLAWATGC